MPNVQQLLNMEIRRLARKEIKVALESLMDANRALKTRVSDLEKAVKNFSTKGFVTEPVGDVEKTSAGQDVLVSEKRVPFHPKMVKNLRRKFGLSQKQIAILLDVSPLSICFWENGRVSPGPECLRKINELRTTPKAEVLKKISDNGLKVSRKRVRNRMKKENLDAASASSASKTDAGQENNPAPQA